MKLRVKTVSLCTWPRAANKSARRRHAIAATPRIATTLHRGRRQQRLQRPPRYAPVDAQVRCLAHETLHKWRVGKGIVGMAIGHQQRRAALAVVVAGRQHVERKRPATDSAACQMDAGTLSQRLRDIDDKVLRRQLLALCTAIIEADTHMADAALRVLLAAVEHWGLTHAVRQAPVHGLTF